MTTIPDAVAKLPVDDRGYPIPWVSLWIDPDSDNTEDQTRWDLVHGDVIDCDCKIGVGVARLGRICPRRQMTGVMERICGTCGEPIDGWCAWPVDNTGGKVTEAPNHPECFAYSLSACPFLKRAPQRFESFHVLLARDYRYSYGREINHPRYGTVIGEFAFDTPSAFLRNQGPLLLLFIDTACGDLVPVDQLWGHPAMKGVPRPVLY